MNRNNWSTASVITDWLIKWIFIIQCVFMCVFLVCVKEDKLKWVKVRHQTRRKLRNLGTGCYPPFARLKFNWLNYPLIFKNVGEWVWMLRGGLGILDWDDNSCEWRQLMDINNWMAHMWFGPPNLCFSKFWKLKSGNKCFKIL